MATTVLKSVEADRLFASMQYLDLLRREADAGGLDYHVGRLQGGAGEEEIIASLAGSEEYLAKA